MKKYLYFMKSAVATFCLALTFTTASVLADDLEIYNTTQSSSPPVNVMFLFDLSGSMLWTPEGDQSPAHGETTRKDILLEALTKVLANNKDKENLRVGFSWFSTDGHGISYPVTDISADLHDLDPNVPANTHYVYNQIPKELDEISIWSGDSTNIVDGIFKTALYFRGDKTWWSYIPSKWNNATGTYDRDDSINPLSYTPEPGPETWKLVENEATGECDYKMGLFSTCKPGYSDSYKKQVYGCYTKTYGKCHPYSCTIVDEHQTCICHNETSHTKQVCKFKYDKNTYKWLGARYKTPIEDSCQASYIVLLSDGEPTRNNHRAYVRDHIVKSECKKRPDLPNGECGPELVELLANNDQIPAIVGSKVNTYTIGFNVDGKGKAYLKTLAEKGKGEFYPASDAADLEQAFEQIIKSITAENESFSSLVTTIRASTLSSDNRVFLSMFKPENTRSWKGNTKGYFIDNTGLKDVDGLEATTVNSETNVDKFTTLARSFWSAGPDGNFVEQGGASSKIEQNNSRTIYTYTDTVAPNNSALTELDISETEITPLLLGVPDETSKNDIINWLHNDAGMGDPLHAKPILLTYETGGSKKDILFSMTNQGLVHAIDTTNPTAFGDHSGGTEIFSFVPQALLPQLKKHKNNIQSPEHSYGLDGVITYFHADTNNDRIVNDSEKVYLYFGMRRGGKNYYALDISNLSSPSLQWRIEGGTGDFKQLAQTWSALTPVNIKWTGGLTKTALIFGGGYDEDQDKHLVRTEDDTGNAIYIVDAVSGEYLWSATFEDPKIDADNNMKYSIPSSIRVIDTNKDHHVDRLYFGDMGGQVWRIDLVDSDNNKSISGYRLADFSEDNIAEKTRRFYSPPSIAKLKNTNNSGYHYTVAIGSGFRAHPNLKVVSDRIYMLRDTNIDTGPPAANWTTITNTHLLNITDNAIGAGDEQAITDLADMDGWFLDLEDDGEKSLTPLLTLDGNLTFTTFTPRKVEPGALQCGGGGKGRYYLFNLSDATPVKNLDDKTPSDKTRSVTITGNGIPTEVSTYTSPIATDGKVPDSRIIVGKRMIDSKTEQVYELNWKKIK